MCGIAGMVGGGRLEVVRPMIEALTHRGPDGDGFYPTNARALGYRRLSIIDLDVHTQA